MVVRVFVFNSSGLLLMQSSFSKNSADTELPFPMVATLYAANMLSSSVGVELLSMEASGDRVLWESILDNQGEILASMVLMSDEAFVANEKLSKTLKMCGTALMDLISPKKVATGLQPESLGEEKLKLKTAIRRILKEMVEDTQFFHHINAP